MRHSLKLHPDSRCDAATSIEVYVSRGRTGNLLLHYYLTGIGNIAIPSLAGWTRDDGLWRHTCFEAFLRPSQGDAYYEFNFSPSTQWAAYRFEGTRSGMRNASEIAPQIELRRESDRFELRAHLTLDGLSDLPTESPWRLGLSAVIEETNGRLSYWALAHPPGKPDFHHSDCFALELPAILPP